jgi:hypothetical protein
MPVPTEFSLFPQLPRELRDVIWRHACPEGQIIEVELVNGRLLGANESTRPCPLLLACKESKTIYLRDWLQLCFYEKLVGQVISRYLVYLNPAVDTLYFGPSTTGENHMHANTNLAGLFRPYPMLKNLRSMAFEAHLWRSGRGALFGTLSYRQWVNEIASVFPRVDAINVIRLDVTSSQIQQKGRPEGEIKFHEIADLRQAHVQREFPLLKKLNSYLNGHPEIRMPLFELKYITRGGTSDFDDEVPVSSSKFIDPFN